MLKPIRPETEIMDRARPSSDDNATLSERIDSMIAKCRRRGFGLCVEEVEKLYTDGCAEALMLEAKLRRVKQRRLAAPHGGAGEDPPSSTDALAQHAERVASELAELRSQLRHLRPALEWVQSGPLIEQNIRFEPAAPRNGAAQL